MAIVVKSIDELHRVMMQQAKKAMQHTEDNMTEIIGERIEKNVYQAYTPTVYERTGGLKSSLTTETYSLGANRVRSLINHDPTYANWYSVQDGSKFEDVSEVVSFGSYGTFNGIGHDGYMHHLNPAGTRWGKPRFYMYMGTQEYMEALEWNLPLGCRVTSYR